MSGGGPTKSHEANERYFKIIMNPKSRFVFTLVIAWAVGCAAILATGAPAASSDAQELSDLLRKHLPGADESALKKTSVEELIAQFPGRVRWSTSSNSSPVEAKDVEPTVSTRLAEGRFAYARIARLDRNAAALKAGLASLVASNRVEGGILDLRFSGGDDFASVPAMASLVLSEKRPVLDYGEGVKESEGNAVLGKIPWVVLANGETSGSAEALAVVLRRLDAAVLMGETTAGRASRMTTFTLRDGRTLEIATQPTKTGDGQVLDGRGMKPDVELKLDKGAERLAISQFLKAAPQESATRPSPAAAGATNAASSRAARRRLNEADLVRMQAEGRRADSELPSPAAEAASVRPASAPFDASLSRALDLLKALSLLKGSGRE